MVDIGHTKGSCAVLFQRPKKQANKQINAGEKELKKKYKSEKKKVSMETTLLTLEYSGHTICGMIVFILLSVSLCV